jgi:hypothetical protein
LIDTYEIFLGDPIFAETFTVVRAGEKSHEVVGCVSQGKRGDRRPYVMLHEDADVAPGDTLVPSPHREELLIESVEIHVSSGKTLGLDAFYSTETERARRSTQAGPDPSSAQSKALGAIAERGGDDKHDLSDFLAKVAAMAEQDTISRGSLKDYSELIKRHRWIAQDISNTLLTWLVGKD